MTFKNASIHMNHEENIVQFIIWQLEDTNYNSFIKVMLNWTLFWKRLLRYLPSLRIWIHTLISFDLRLNAYDNKIKVMIRLYNHFWNELLISWIERLNFVWELIWVVHNIVFFAEVNHTLFNHNQHVFIKWWWGMICNLMFFWMCQLTKKP